MEYTCPFCKIELHVHFSGGVFDIYEGKFSCPECGYILNQGDYYVLTANGYVEKPPKPVVKPVIHLK